MDRFIAWVAALSRLCGMVASAMILAAVVVVCQMVFMRYVMEVSTIWQTEFVTYLLIAATLVGSPYVLLTRGHVHVDLLPMYLGERGRRRLALLAALLALAFCLVMTWTGTAMWWEAWENRWLSDTVWGVRLWIPYLAMPVGFGILSLQYVADILSLLAGRSAPFAPAPGAAE